MILNSPAFMFDEPDARSGFGSFNSNEQLEKSTPMQSESMAETQMRKLGGNLDTLKKLLLQSSDLEPVFVSIDFEGLENIFQNFQHSSNAQVGIASLDTRNITSGTSRITTHNLMCGSDDYFNTTAQKVVWGTATRIQATNLLDEINQRLDRTRNIVLVGHGFKHDLGILESLGFDLETNITSIFCTFRLAPECKIRNRTSGMTLRGILTELGCPYTNMHVGGNDSNFTLRALLMMALKTRKGGILNEDGSAYDSGRIIALQSIARAHS